jgi:hypothetical protein
MNGRINSRGLMQRVEGLSHIEHALGESLQTVIKVYHGRLFRGSNVDKGSFFEECLRLELSEDSEQLLSERCKLSFHRDRRSSVEYGLDLVFGWLSEDLIFHALRHRGVEIELSGEDKFREFLRQDEIGTSPDCLVNFKGLQRPLEIVISWKGYWQTSDKLDLRESKFGRLIGQGNESLCLGIELPSGRAFLIDMKSSRGDFVFRANPAWGYKGAFTLYGIRSKLDDLKNVIDRF